VKLYLLPLGRNHLSAFVARHDSWYNRNVYIPFRHQTFVCPWMNCDDESQLKDEDSELTLPGTYLRRTVEDYLREAELPFNFNVWKIEGWIEKGKESKDGKDDEKHDSLIPFIQRVEMGLGVTVEQYRIKKNFVETMKTEEIMKDRGFPQQFTPPEVKVKFVQVDMNGKATQTIDDDPAAYNTILLSSVARLGDKCVPPDPSAPWLEVYGAPLKAIKRSGELKKNILLMDNRQHVAFMEITCASESANFMILVDGQLQGPFYKIKISPALDSKDRKVTFPIQTFFPIQL